MANCNSSENKQTTRIAVVQAGSALFETTKSLEKLATFTAETARQQAELVVFPEAFIGGYYKGHDFGVSVGIRVPAGREEFRKLFDSAIEIPGPAVDVIGDIAKEHSVHLVVGVIEKSGGTLYCTALMFSPEGVLLGKHRKLMPTAAERLIWGNGDGSTIPVIDTGIGKLGAVICWENYMPLLRMAMYAKNIELYCAITVDDRETWMSTVRHIAMEGRCFVLSACQYVSRRDLPADYPTKLLPQDDEDVIRGGSCIVGPLGEVIAGPLYGEEGILVADINHEAITKAKFDFDVTGHYARPDVFRLTVNEQSMPAVEFRNEVD